MGLHFIKNGTKHDVCVKRPSLFPASATTYDNSNSGLSATRVQGAIDELAGRFYTIDYTVKLNQQTWTASGSGMYYAVIAPPNGDTVVSALCSEWSNLRTSDFVQPYTENNNVGLISNVSSFATGASAYNLRVLYCKQ